MEDDVITTDSRDTNLVHTRPQSLLVRVIMGKQRVAEVSELDTLSRSVLISDIMLYNIRTKYS
jgi:hypothetical protein